MLRRLHLRGRRFGGPACLHSLIGPLVDRGRRARVLASGPELVLGSGRRVWVLDAPVRKGASGRAHRGGLSVTCASSCEARGGGWLIFSSSSARPDEAGDEDEELRRRPRVRGGRKRGLRKRLA